MFYCVFFYAMPVALEQADALVRQADIVAAMTLEVLKGTTRAFDAGMLRSDVRVELMLQVLSTQRACVKG